MNANDYAILKHII